MESGESVFSPEEYAAVVPREDVGDGQAWRGVATEEEYRPGEFPLVSSEISLPIRGMLIRHVA